MSIEELTVHGYRSLKELTWRPSALKVVVGANASGKSNLLRALTYLRAAATGEMPNNMLREGGMGSILWDSRVQQLHLA